MIKKLVPPPLPVDATIWDKIKNRYEHYQYRQGRKKRIEWNPLIINVEVTLQQNLSFWLPIIFFVGWGICLTRPFWCWCIPNPAHYSLLFEQLKFPFFIASLAIPISVIVARFHASKLAIKKLEISSKADTFKQFYEHLDLFEKFAERKRIKSQFSELIEIVDIERLYKLFFLQNSPQEQNFSLPREQFNALLAQQFEEVTEKLEIIRSLFEKHGRDSVRDKEFYNVIKILPESFGLNVKADIFEYYSNSKVPLSDIKFLIFVLNFILRYLQEIQHFNFHHTRNWELTEPFKDVVRRLETDSGFIDIEKDIYSAVLSFSIS